MVSAACGAGWHRPARLELGPVSPRQQVQVWSGGSARRWHAVQVGPDSIRGIPYLRPIDCDNCRISLPRASVDSLRLGNPVAGFWSTVAVVLVVPTLVVFVACATHGGCITPD